MDAQTIIKRSKLNSESTSIIKLYDKFPNKVQLHDQIREIVQKCINKRKQFTSAYEVFINYHFYSSPGQVIDESYYEQVKQLRQNYNELSYQDKLPFVLAYLQLSCQIQIVSVVDVQTARQHKIEELEHLYETMDDIDEKVLSDSYALYTSRREPEQIVEYPETSFQKCLKKSYENEAERIAYELLQKKMLKYNCTESLYVAYMKLTNAGGNLKMRNGHKDKKNEEFEMLDKKSLDTFRQAYRLYKTLRKQYDDSEV